MEPHREQNRDRDKPFRRLTQRRHAGIVVGRLTAGETDVRIYGDSGTPRALDSNTKFEVGSITKVFTATVLADMVLQGEVSLDDSLGRYISGVALPTRDGESIRLVDLATHTAGLPRIPRNLWPNMFKSPKNPYAGYSRADLYEALSTVKIRRTFRTNMRYSNFGFALLGHALEIAAGIPYERLLDERLFAPLGMDSTTIHIAETERERIAQGHKKKKTVPPWDLGAFEGAGAVRSTLDDMLRFLRTNMYREGRIGEAARFAHAPRHVKKSGRQEVGLGWMRTRGRSGRWTVWHNGGTGGFSSFVGFISGGDAGIAVLSNSRMTLTFNASCMKELN